jgi:hypothetical protein
VFGRKGRRRHGTRAAERHRHTAAPSSATEPTRELPTQPLRSAATLLTRAQQHRIARERLGEPDRDDFRWRA